MLCVLSGSREKEYGEFVTQDPRKGALLPLHGKEREWPPDHKERERPPNNQGARRVGGRGRQSIFVCVVVSGLLRLGRKMGQEDPRTETQDPRTRVEDKRYNNQWRQNVWAPAVGPLAGGVSDPTSPLRHTALGSERARRPLITPDCV